MTRLVRGPLVAAVLAAMATAASASEMPWKHSHLLYTHSEPSLVDNRSEVIATSDERLAIVTRTGVATMAWQDDAWRAMSHVESSDPVDAAWGNQDVLVLLTRDGTSLLRARDGRFASLDLPGLEGGQDGALGRLPGSSHVVAHIHNRTYVIDVGTGSVQQTDLRLGSGRAAMASSQTEGALFLVVDGTLHQWDVGADEPVAWEDHEGEQPDFGEQARQVLVHPDGGLLYVGTHGEGLYAVDLTERRVQHMSSETHGELVSDLFYARIAIDQKRDTLYYTSWTEAMGLHPASDPENWEPVGYLTSFTDPPLHTYRSNSPTAGMVYLPESDELLFGGRWGVSVLSTQPTSKLVADEQFDKLARTPDTIPGEGSFYDFMRENRMRSIWTGSGRAGQREHFENLDRAGINTIFYNIYYAGHDEFYGPHELSEHLRDLAAKAETWDIRIIVAARPIGSSGMSHSGVRDHPYRHWILPSGEVAAYDEPMPAAEGVRDRLEFPCPVDEGYWERSIAPVMLKAAEIGAEYEAVEGVLWELGDGFRQANFNPRNTPCLCDVCWTRFLDREQVEDAEARELAADDGQRRRWLHQNNGWGAYEDSMVAGMEEVGQHFLAEARAIYPELTTHLALPETGTHYDESWWYRGFIRAMHDSAMPVVVSSQQAYGAPHNPVMDTLLERRLREAGKHTIVVPGLALLWLSPEQVTQRYEQKNYYSPGVFVYRGDRWYGNNLDENHFRGRLPGDQRQITLREYIDALERAELKVPSTE